MDDKRNKAAVLTRLARLEGQIRGITRMVEEDRYCVDVLIQAAAVRAALRAIEKLLIEDHARTCLEKAASSADADERRAKFHELLDLIEKARD
jgi:DNA-binding FrmR family transcriptional regulator